jgi:hypothetical protein
MGAAAHVIAVLIGWTLLIWPAQAAYMVTLSQVGTDLVATGSGTIDLAALSVFETGAASPFIEPSIGYISTGAETVASFYHGNTGKISGPTSFGSGGGIFANSGSGDTVGYPVKPVASRSRPSTALNPERTAQVGPVADPRRSAAVANG